MATFVRDGQSLYYEVHGDGPALVFAHGRGGCGASWWQQIPAFASAYRTVTFDHRGFARSAAPDGPHVAAFADDLAALLDHLAIERAVLVGQSLGGRTCLGLAARRPDRVRGLVLSCTAGGLKIPEVEESQAARAAIPRGIDHPTAALSPGFREREPARSFLYETLRSLTPPPGPLFRASLDGLEPGVAASDVAGFAVPTLILAGEHDTLYPEHVLKAVEAALPGSRLRRIDGVGHSPYWERPDVFNAVLDDFLKTLPA